MVAKCASGTRQLVLKEAALCYCNWDFGVFPLVVFRHTAGACRSMGVCNLSSGMLAIAKASTEEAGGLRMW